MDVIQSRALKLLQNSIGIKKNPNGMANRENIENALKGWTFKTGFDGYVSAKHPANKLTVKFPKEFKRLSSIEFKHSNPDGLNETLESLPYAAQLKIGHQFKKQLNPDKTVSKPRLKLLPTDKVLRQAAGILRSHFYAKTNTLPSGFQFNPKAAQTKPFKLHEFDIQG